MLDPVTIVYLPPKKYPTGTLTFEHTFPENGKFIGIVTVQKRTWPDLCLTIPLFGGSTGWQKHSGFTDLLAAVGLGAVYGLWHYGGKQKKKPVVPKSPA